MTLILDLPETTLRWLESEAEAKGTDTSSFANDQLAAAQARAEARAILNGPFHTLAEADERFLTKYNLPDLSHLSREQLADRLTDGLAKVDADKLAEAERQGLL